MTELKTVIKRALGAVQHDIRLFYDWGNYKSRKTHRLSDVEYKTRLDMASVNLCNMVIDNLVAEWVMKNIPLGQKTWEKTRSTVMELLEAEIKAEYEAKNPRPDNQDTGPVKK